ncbi:hypothetical protein [Pseudomonas sp.]|jgi:hypothetical protein|uniref:hypothetical protein n=1 Tax=Pseudomonas sp. TaxID=306 RepID=UPI003262F71D
MLRQLFISGAVAACNMEVIDRNAVKNDAFAGLVLSASVVKYICCSAFHQNLSQLNQVAL